MKVIKNKGSTSSLSQKLARPNLLSESLMKKTKEIIVGTCLAGTVISRRMIIAIGTAVVKANEPNFMKEYGGTIELTEMWARTLLNSMDWVKRKGTTGKVSSQNTAFTKDV